MGQTAEDLHYLMGRYRAPTKPSSPYITAEGQRALSEEWRYLWKTLRPEVTAALAAAAAEGDRSENAEYIYRKKQLGEIDRRVRYLSKRLDAVKVISDRPRDTRAVYFGAKIEIEDEAGQRFRYRVVGADEIDAARGYISIDSPLARSLLKKRIGDEVVVELPGGTATYVLIRIDYA